MAVRFRPAPLPVATLIDLRMVATLGQMFTRRIGRTPTSVNISPHTVLASRDLFTLAPASSGMPKPGMARYLSSLTCGIAWDKRVGIDDIYPTAVHCQEALIAQGIHLALIDNQNCRDAAASHARRNNAIHVRSLDCMVSLSPMIG